MTTPPISAAPVTAEACTEDERTGLEKVVKRIVDQAPPLTDQQRARLAVLLQPSGTGEGVAKKNPEAA
ncbi:hypothetical protein ACQPZX_42750 [Actinoplanes sp. CA-142083]|uniref:hypothetical protein n=1 Tax=Actinoplanes sp. CA-142083 TaxID=3239903 RepID=UPI003D89FE9A